MPRESTICLADKGSITKTTPTVVTRKRKRRRGNGDDKRLKRQLTHGEHRYCPMSNPHAGRSDRLESERDTLFTLQTAGI